MSESDMNPSASAPARRTALYATHVALGAKLGDFGGWDMPIEYEGGGVLAEHLAVRERVGVFDVSHLGTLTVNGPGAAAFIDTCFTNALARIAPGGAQYTLCCTPEGGVVDDLIIYLWGPDDVLLVPNAANTAEVQRMLEAAAPQGITVTDLQADMAILAVQGPLSAEVLAALGLPHEHDYMRFEQTRWRDHPVTVCRTGYTGEHGYELMIPNAGALDLWTALVEQITERGGRPAGLGARDTLRTEMGYPLHGHELSLQITAVQAGAGWAVGWEKPEFWGREALLAEKARGPQRRARGLLAIGRGIPRAEMMVKLGEEVVGVTTSGTFSPTLSQGIALALVDSSVPLETEVMVDVRGRALACRVVKPPFVEVQTRTP